MFGKNSRDFRRHPAIQTVGGALRGKEGGGGVVETENGRNARAAVRGGRMGGGARCTAMDGPESWRAGITRGKWIPLHRSIGGELEGGVIVVGDVGTTEARYFPGVNTAGARYVSVFRATWRGPDRGCLEGCGRTRSR